MPELAPWFALAGLGLYHGLNPAMGWLFAGSIGERQESLEAALFALIPIAIGHALSIALVATLAVTAGFFLDENLLRKIASALLLCWGLYCLFAGARHLMPASLGASFTGLGLWSFFMATAHGAGLMLVPALMPLCLSNSAAAELGAAGSLSIAGAAVFVHMAAMLSMTGLLAGAYCKGMQAAFPDSRRRLLDFLWAVVLAGAGLWLIWS
jgi:hypothetical protein